MAYKEEERKGISNGGGSGTMTSTPRRKIPKEYIAAVVGIFLFASLFSVGIAASYVIVS